MSEAFDIVKFRDFCAGKPAGERYPAWDPCRCALAQFGLPGVDGGRLSGVPSEVYHAVVGAVTLGEDTTFSALASRLSALIREGGNV